LSSPSLISVFKITARRKKRTNKETSGSDGAKAEQETSGRLTDFKAGKVQTTRKRKNKDENPSKGQEQDDRKEVSPPESKKRCWTAGMLDERVLWVKSGCRVQQGGSKEGSRNDGSVDGWLDGWMDGWMGGWLPRWWGVLHRSQ